MAIKEGYRFGVYNGDAKGTVKTANTQRVEYSFDHSLEVTWDQDRKNFEANTFPLVESNN